MTSRFQFVPVGEFRISADPSVELITVTGSCVAVILYDTANHVAGMLHVVLPGRRKTWRRQDNNSYFADTGVPMLIEGMIRHGASEENLKASVLGGGAILQDVDNGTHIGEQNVEAVTQWLNRYNIPIIRMETGGNQGRRVILKVANGQVVAQPIAHYEPSDEAFDKDFLSSDHAEMLLARMLALKPASVWSEKLLEAIYRIPVDWKDVQMSVSKGLVLAMHFFRIANSSYYGHPGEIASFEQALGVLGTRQVRRICLLASVIRHGDNMADDVKISATVLSRHSLATAVISRYLAAHMSPRFQKEVFTAGLLHGIGDLGLILLQDLDLNIDINSGQIGSFILKKWNIPQQITTAVASYETLTPDDNEFPTLAEFLHVGCALSRLLEMMPSTPHATFGFSSEMLERIGRSEGLSGIIPGIIKELKSNRLTRYFDF